MSRFALCVGGSRYRALDKLHGTLNDVVAVEVKCKELGFEVRKIVDDENDVLHDHVGSFVKKVSAGDTVFVFLSGHGAQFRGDNYFLPIDFKEEKPGKSRNDYVRHALAIYRSIVQPLQAQKPRLIFIALDACRANAVIATKSPAAASQGFAPIDAPL